MFPKPLLSRPVPRSGLRQHVILPVQQAKALTASMIPMPHGRQHGQTSGAARLSGIKALPCSAVAGTTRHRSGGGEPKRRSQATTELRQTDHAEPDPDSSCESVQLLLDWLGQDSLPSLIDPRHGFGESVPLVTPARLRGGRWRQCDPLCACDLDAWESLDGGGHDHIGRAWLWRNLDSGSDN
jgi:hypothetical protein